MDGTQRELQRRGIGRSLEEMLGEAREMIAESVRFVPAGRSAADPSREFTLEEREVLQRGGMYPDTSAGEAEQYDTEQLAHDISTTPVGSSGGAVARTISSHAALMASALTETEAARLLCGVSAARIRQRIGERSLYAISTPEGRRVARFQFTQDGEVPHAGEVLREVPEDAHPVAVSRWFTEPDPDLSTGEGGEEDQPLSPRDWLISGGSPGPVKRLAREL